MKRAGLEIAEQVAAEQPLRQRRLPRADGEVHLVRRRELLGDLVAGVAAAHHQHGPAGNVAPARGSRRCASGRCSRRAARRSAGTRGVWNGPVAITTWSAAYARSRSSTTKPPSSPPRTARTSLLNSHGQVEVLRVAREVVDDLVAAGIGVGIAGEREPGQAVVAHGREQLQRVPPLAPGRGRQRRPPRGS